MKKFLLLILLAFLVNIPVLAKVVCNPFETVYDEKIIKSYGVFTTKITTEEGCYRIFLYSRFNSGGITAIKIK